MSFKFRDELVATPPKLSLSILPIHKRLPPTPGAITPPLHPMVSVPFEWEEVPGRPRSITISSPYKPKIVRCLELPPKMLLDSSVTNMPYSPTSILNGPTKLGRTLSHKFFLEDISPNVLKDHDGSGRGNNGGPSDWAAKCTKLDHKVCKPNVVVVDSWYKCGSLRSDVDIDVRMSRFMRRRGSLYRLSCKSSRLIDTMYQGLKQMIVRGRKEGNLRTSRLP